MSLCAVYPMVRESVAQPFLPASPLDFVGELALFSCAFPIFYWSAARTGHSSQHWASEQKKRAINCKNLIR